MKKKIQTEEASEAEEWKNKYLRVLADYQNLEKRSQSERIEIRRFAAEVVIGRILPTLDTLAKAKAHIGDPGLDLAYKELESALSELGVTKIEVVGKEFNPHEMECIEVVEGEDNKVTEELLPGYKLHEKVVRVAQVKVGKPKEVQHV